MNPWVHSVCYDNHEITSKERKVNLLRKTNYIHTCASEGNGLKPNLLLLFSVTMCMRHMRKNMTHRLLMAIICMMIGMVIPLSPAISHAEGGGINVPSVDDHFYKPKEGPKPEEQKRSTMKTPKWKHRSKNNNRNPKTKRKTTVRIPGQS